MIEPSRALGKQTTEALPRSLRSGAADTPTRRLYGVATPEPTRRHWGIVEQLTAEERKLSDCHRAKICRDRIGTEGRGYRKKDNEQLRYKSISPDISHLDSIAIRLLSLAVGWQPMQWRNAMPRSALRHGVISSSSSLRLQRSIGLLSKLLNELPDR